MSTCENNITFFIHEPEDNTNNNTINNNININDLLQCYENDVFESYEPRDNDDLIVSKMVDYTLNYTVKDLLLICDYYGIAKNLKITKPKKEQIIESLVLFENEATHKGVVNKRKSMWFYMNELKKDKFMKKYIMLW